MKELIDELAKFTKIVVTGPQRSGTTIATRILAAELGYAFLREEAFQIHRLDLFFKLVLERDRFVIQAPTLSSCCHFFTGVAVVFMRREVADILASAKRVNWIRGGFEKAKYFDASSRSSAEVKYQAWDNFQKHLLRGRGFDLPYESLRGHPLWVEKEGRQDFSLRQVEPKKP